MTHGWKAMNHMIFLRPKREGLCHTAKNNFIITVHWSVWKISFCQQAFLFYFSGGQTTLSCSQQIGEVRI